MQKIDKLVGLIFPERKQYLPKEFDRIQAILISETYASKRLIKNLEHEVITMGTSNDLSKNRSFILNKKPALNNFKKSVEKTINHSTSHLKNINSFISRNNTSYTTFSNTFAQKKKPKQPHSETNNCLRNQISEISFVDRKVNLKIKRLQLNNHKNSLANIDVKLEGDLLTVTNKYFLTKLEMKIEDFFGEIVTLFQRFFCGTEVSQEIAGNRFRALVKANDPQVETLIQFIFFDNNNQLRQNLSVTVFLLYLSLYKSYHQKTPLKNTFRSLVHTVQASNIPKNQNFPSILTSKDNNQDYRRCNVSKDKKGKSTVFNTSNLTLKLDKIGKNTLSRLTQFKSKSAGESLYLKTLYAVLLRLRHYSHETQIGFIQKNLSQCCNLRETIRELNGERKKNRIVWDHFEKQRMVKMAMLAGPDKTIDKKINQEIDLDKLQELLLLKKIQLEQRQKIEI